MKSDGLNKIRFFLINIGKTLPFVLCAIVFISYSECIYALITEDFVEYGDCVTLNKPISWAIGNLFEYNIQALFVITVLSFAIKTCIYNKLAIIYLFVNLWEKSYFMTVELYIEQVYIIVIANIIISSFFVYKGIKMITNK